jgi:hypothetical protein
MSIAAAERWRSSEGAVRVLSVITEPRVIAAILAHLEGRAARAPPLLQH